MSNVLRGLALICGGPIGLATLISAEMNMSREEQKSKSEKEENIEIEEDQMIKQNIEHVIRVIDPSLEVEDDHEYINNISIKDTLEYRSKNKTIESICSNEKVFDSKYQHGFLTAAHIAHAKHIPLQFGPDHVWAFIMQGFSEHMRLNHEKLRSVFVSFEGKKELVVRLDSFVKGMQNDWASVLPQFSKQIRQNIGNENHENLVPKFTTTCPLNQVIHECALMNAMQHYFSFTGRTDCGISKVRLDGTLQDWEKLRAQTEKLGEYQLEWWTKGLLEIIDKFIETYQGNVDPLFWKFIYKYYQAFGSGASDSIDGWIVSFIPYLDDKPSEYALRSLAETMNAMKEQEEKENQEQIDAQNQSNSGSDFDLEWEPTINPGIDITKLKKCANGISQTPFIWQYHGEEYDMNLISGFAGAQLQESGFVTPKLAWAVSEKAPAKSNQKKKML